MLALGNVLDKETGAIDQEGVNRLVDYAIAHGVNYFDTAPVYCNGECERVTGIALRRHPRDKYYIAAKISNLEPETWSREETLKMYYNSFKELQVDYIDYMMLHGVGMDFLDSTAQKFVRYPLIPCNDCKYCMPCPYGIDIPGILSHFNKCINEDLMPVSSQDENYRELRRAFLIGYDRSVPKLRQADHCVGCDQCIRKCPQRINIPKQMRRIDKFVESLKQEKEFNDKTNYLWSR